MDAMKKQPKTILLVLVGVAILCVIVGGTIAAWFVTTAYNSVASDERSATRAFDEVRERFGGVAPLIEIRRAQEAVLAREPPDTPPAHALRTVHVLAWDPDEESLRQVALPTWLLRMSSDPLELTAGSGISAGTNLTMTAEELERYGPTLVIDHLTDRGERFLVWTE